MITAHAKLRKPIRDCNSFKVTLSLSRKDSNKVLAFSSLSGGSFVCCDTTSISNPRKVILLAGPLVFSLAIGTPRDLHKLMKVSSMDFVFDNIGTGDWKANKGFDDWEVVKMRRNFVGVVNKAKAHEGDNLTVLNSIRTNRTRFYDFINEYDRRRNTNFIEIFPEYKDFYELCKQEHKIFYKNKEAKKNAKTGNN